MIKKTTKAIVLKRVSYGDYDRIITILTPHSGKLSLMARGVRKINSKIAGGIELFSVLDAGYLDGKGEVGRLTSARLDEFYGDIINDINRVKLGYSILKTFDKQIEDNSESVYFYLLIQLLRLLNQQSISLTSIELYFKSKLLTLAGHAPNLQSDFRGQPLKESEKYNFDVASMTLNESDSGRLKAAHIKLLRLLFDDKTSEDIVKIKVSKNEDEDLLPLIDAMFSAHL